MMLPGTALAARQAELASRAAANANNFFNGKYDRLYFINAFEAAFAKSHSVNAQSASATCRLLGFIEKDSAVNDVRWAAYLLATAFKETRWTMEPIDERGQGAGKAYGSAVKVYQLKDGRVRITEQDGDQFVLGKSGYWSAPLPLPVMGATFGGKVNEGYSKDLGDEHIYFGRGYVQLTHWDGYAQTGIKMGRGFEFLLDPESVKTPEIAYAILSDRLVKGVNVAGKLTLASFISGSKCDYIGARALVNKGDDAKEVAGLAERFETALRASVAVS